MYTCEMMIQSLRDGVHDEILKSLYSIDGTPERLNWARNRAIRVTTEFYKRFAPEPDTKAALFSGPGRTEIGGNHTDHQHGHVLCGSVDLDMLACAAPNTLNMLRIYSEGYPEVSISLNQLFLHEEERNTSAALARGMAAKIAEMGYPLFGMDVYIVSDVLSGSGLSSSAAFEVLIGNILNYYCCSGALNQIEIAKAGQYTENTYFGKPCGLMDQLGASVGGAVAIDFLDPNKPVVTKVPFDFSGCGHALCIVDSGSCHSDLTGDYAEVTQDMYAIANYFCKHYLREIPEDAFYAEIPHLRSCCGDRAVLRAMHYYADDKRAVEEAEALAEGDFHRFLALVNESGLSSATNLQNIWSSTSTKERAVALALAIGKKLLDGTGAIRVHGGGFAGTIQAFVPNEKLDVFKCGMETIFGPGKCHVLHIRPVGGCVVIG